MGVLVVMSNADALQTQHSVIHPTPLQRRRTFISPAPPPRTRKPAISGLLSPSSSPPMSQSSASAQRSRSKPAPPPHTITTPLPFQTVLHTWYDGLA
ncbi:hypothetical protein H2248_012253 [Termitomyces sp. 'cryptogamus']|nr:hypothetical protein H2248_012253 [Termitomyces sp. 'cryptogamus']